MRNIEKHKEIVKENAELLKLLLHKISTERMWNKISSFTGGHYKEWMIRDEIDHIRSVQFAGFVQILFNSKITFKKKLYFTLFHR